MRTQFVPFSQTPSIAQPLLKPLMLRFSAKFNSPPPSSDVFVRTPEASISSPTATAVNTIIGLGKQFPVDTSISLVNGPSVSQTWIPPLNLNLPDSSVHARVVVPSDALSTQGYHQVRWEHPVTRERFDLSRSSIGNDGMMQFELRPVNQPNAIPQTKRLHVSQLPQMAVIDNFRPSHDLDGDGQDCVSHGDMVLHVARRVNPFGVYHVVQPHVSGTGSVGDIITEDRPVIDALLRQHTHTISSINFSYGQTVPIPMLGFLLGEEVTLQTLPSQTGMIRDYMQQAYRLNYGKFKATYFEGFRRQAKHYAKVFRANPADFTDDQIGYDFMFMYDRLREAHLDHKQFKRLKEAGIQPYLSAGNSGSHTISLSALSPDAIVVGGLDEHGQPAEFSSSVLPHHPSVRAEFPIRVTPKGINFTDTPDVVDIPAEWLPVTATMMQVGHLLGRPINDLVFKDDEINELMVRSGRRYAARYTRQLVASRDQNLLFTPPLSREALMKTLSLKLLTHAQLNRVAPSLGLPPIRLKPIGSYVALTPDAALLQVNVDESGLTMPALTKPMDVVRGTSFSSPAVMAKKELDDFVMGHFMFDLAA